VTVVTMFTDGACSGNPGPAGWAAILVSGKREKEVVGGARESTNNRAESMAAIVGLEALKFACEVTVRTDSTYVCAVGNPARKKIRANLDLVARLDALKASHSVTFVKTPRTHPMIVRCDALAKAEVERQRSLKQVELQSFCPQYDDCSRCDVPSCPADKYTGRVVTGTAT